MVSVGQVLWGEVVCTVLLLYRSGLSILLAVVLLPLHVLSCSVVAILPTPLLIDAAASGARHPSRSGVQVAAVLLEN
jgi:hypothetical protein